MRQTCISKLDYQQSSDLLVNFNYFQTANIFFTQISLLNVHLIAHSFPCIHFQWCVTSSRVVLSTKQHPYHVPFRPLVETLGLPTCFRVQFQKNFCRVTVLQVNEFDRIRLTFQKGNISTTIGSINLKPTNPEFWNVVKPSPLSRVLTRGVKSPVQPVT